MNKSPIESKPVIRPVQYTKVTHESGEQLQTFSGTTKADTEATLSFKVAGTIRERPVNVGDEVKAGQIVARLDTPDFKVAVEKAQAVLAAAQAELRNAEANYDRIRSLYENENAAKSELDAARAAAESGTAQVKAAK